MGSKLVPLLLYDNSVFDVVLQVCPLFTSILKFGTGFYSQSPLSWYAGHTFVLPALTCWLAKILVGVLRYYVVILLQSSPKKLPRAAIREQCVFTFASTPRRCECKAE
jgi:hypothetical protein